MPGLLDETEAILSFVADEPGVYVTLMAQYYVSGWVGKDGEYEEIARGVDREEYRRALALRDWFGLRLDPAVSATGSGIVYPARSSRAPRDPSVRASSRQGESLSTPAWSRCETS